MNPLSPLSFGATVVAAKTLRERMDWDEKSALELQMIVREEEIQALGHENDEDNMAIVLDSMRYSDDDPTVEASPYPRDMTGYREGDRLDVAHIFVKDPNEAPLKLSVQQEQGGPLADLGENVLGLFLGKNGLGCKDGA